MLPLEIQMQIDLTAQRHHAEVAEGFAKLRAKMMPKPHPSALRDLAMLQARLFGNDADAQMMDKRLWEQMRPANPFAPKWEDMQNVGMMGSASGGLARIFGGLF